MNLNFNKGNRKEVENVSTRVKKTKEEIEKLKNELEKLINLGTQPSYLQPVFERKIPEVGKVSPKPANLLPQEPQPQAKGELVKTVPPRTVPGAQKKPEPAKVSPGKKARNYNVVEAREYIKKQKEKRAEQLKAQINIADNQLDLKKQKLKELHQKTIELVSKNVQLKRDRSKSRDGGPPVRLDKSNPRHKSQETIPKPRPNFSSRSQERLAPTAGPKLQPRAKSQDRAKSQERVKGQAQVKKSSERVGRPRTRDKVEKDPVKPQKVDPNFVCPPKVKITSGKTDLEKKVLPSREIKVDLNKRITSEPSLSLLAEKVEPVDLEKGRNLRPKNQKRVLEHSIMTDACLKDTKETQTNRLNNLEGVGWMQPPPALPYPYNFINTVKRKLQFAISSPKSCVDVGVQNSGETSARSPEPEKVKTREELKEMLIKSTGDVRSFASHRGPNLDLKAVDNLELVPIDNAKFKSSIETVSKNLFDTYESDSDTSKNIPEISSESFGALHAKPQLSLDKLKDLKLQKNPKSHTKTDTNGYSELEADSYSSDFQKESVGGTKSGRSGSSTIQTVPGERFFDTHSPSLNKGIDETSYRYPSDFSKKDPKKTPEGSINTSMASYSLSSTSQGTKDGSGELRSDKDPRSEGNSQKTFKSLLTETQISNPSFASEVPKPKAITESLDLKQPSVSLTFSKISDPRKNLMNTVTIRSGGDLNLESKEAEGLQEVHESVSTEDGVSGSTAASVPESLNQEVSESTASKVGSLSLKEPKVSLVVGKGENRDNLVKSQMKNITLRPAASNNVNEIHLKFEAEVRLLNDFNESFKQFVAVEKAFENLKSKNETNLAMTKVLQNVDTQTSVIAKTSTNVSTPRDTRNSSINFSRGSEVVEELDDSVVNKNASKSLQSTFSTDWNLSHWDASTDVSMGEEGKSKLSISSVENFNAKNCAGILSLNIFDQLIKDEDTRIQQLKAIIKIREQALLDRTKSELVWLEIQKKQLIETGKIEEASLLRKKQRGIILKHEQERNEIKKLKQMQKEASEQRKNTLKQQRNFIKSQLSTENMLSRITVKKQRKERRMGPLRVVQSHSEHSETSISLKSSGIEDVLSITSKSLRVSEESEVEVKEEMPHARRTLLMREAALQKRRKAAEELLRWHRRLLDEERKIGELEAAATSVVRQQAPPDRHRFDGGQLNQLWRSMTGSDEKKFVEEKVYAMSQVALERLCKSARQHSKKVAHAKCAGQSSGSGARKSTEDFNYSSAFEQDSVQEIISQEEKTKISSISELIDNFSRIEDEISTLSKKSEDIVSLKEKTEDSEVSSIRDIEEEEEEPSVVEVVEEQENKNEISREEIEEPTTEKSVDERVSVEDQEAKSVEDISTSIEDQKEILIKNEDRVPKSSQEISTALEDEPISSTKADLELKTSQVSSTIEEQEPKTVTDEVSTGKEDFEERPSVSAIEEQKITTDEQISVEKEVPAEAESITEEREVTADEALSRIEDLEPIQEVKTPTDERVSDERENLETPKSVQEISETIEEKDFTKEKHSSITEEDFESPESGDTDEKSINELIFAEKDLEVQKSVPSSDTQISTKHEDLEKSKLSSEVATSVEDQEVVTDEISKISEALEGLKSVDELSSTQYEYVDKLPENKEATTGEHMSSKDESENVETEDQEKLSPKSAEDVKNSIEDKQEVSSVPVSEIIEESLEEVSKDLAKSLSLEEALESASKIEESLSKLNEKLVSEKKDEDISEELSTGKEIESLEETPSKATSKSESAASAEEKTPQKKSPNQIDVKKRVSEILADASLSRGDKSPRLQDLYVTAYDVGAPISSELTESPEEGRQMPTDIFGSEAEELWRKQLAIEQEIKQIELQQKEQLPYLYVREIPNKPPPPYTPPSSLSSLPQSILPSDVKEITEIACYSSKVLYKAHQNRNLDKVKFSENGFKLFSKVEVTKICAEFVFNICKDIAREHYKQFEEVEGPSWLVLAKKPQLGKTKPADADALERILNQKLKELFGFKKAQTFESAIVKWGRKKRDHVDEVLVIESQEEESQWTNFDKDELIVKNQVAEDIMKMLLEESASVFAKIFSKKKCAVG